MDLDLPIEKAMADLFAAAPSLVSDLLVALEESQGKLSDVQKVLDADREGRTYEPLDIIRRILDEGNPQ